MKKILISCLLAFMCLAKGYAQKPAAKKAYDEGKAYYDDAKYRLAIPLFGKAAAKDPSYQDAWYYLGLSNKYQGNDQDAIDAFKKLETLNPDYWAWFYYEAGKAYETLKQFDAAKLEYQKFLDKYPKESKKELFHHQARYKLANVEAQKELMAMPKMMNEPISLGSKVNSKYDDYMPCSDPTGKRIYFTSKRKGGTDEEAAGDKEGDEDLYYIEKQGNSWSDPVLLPEPINSGSHEGAETFSADGQTMIYTACGRNDGIGSCDLYISYLEGDKWSAPQNLGNIVNSDKWDSQPTLSSDGTKVIFTSERWGGYGSHDLYMIEKNSFGDWGPPMNLGAMINTPFSESSPYLSPDGKTLYFASKGHPGFGGNDLFKSIFENGKWSKPVNMGKPLNSEKEDLYFTIGGSGEIGYFASDITGVKDLYQIDIPESMRPQPTVVVSGVVTNAKTKEPTGAWVLVEDLTSGELIATSKSNSKTGEYLVVLPAGRNYSVSANKEGFFFYSQQFDVPNTAKYQEIKKDIPLKPIEKGTKVVLNNIFFETGKADLKTESYLELAKAVDLMKTNKTMTVEIGGHTDNVGSDEANMSLSHARAKSVRDFLVKAGIESSRLQAKGYGETQPIASNDDDNGRQANRRTEFVILEF